jgi:hypothetical protein
MSATLVALHVLAGATSSIAGLAESAGCETTRQRHKAPVARCKVKRLSRQSLPSNRSEIPRPWFEGNVERVHVEGRPLVEGRVVAVMSTYPT